jgi:hypothetical protein
VTTTTRRRLMPPKATTADVLISAKGPAGGPSAQLLVDSKISAEQLGALIQRVTTDREVFSAAGLRFCGGCKSGLDIFIRDKFEKIIQIQI